MLKVLVIAPHPDDETLGAGGTLLRHIAGGDEVYWCIVTHAFADSADDYRQCRINVIEKVNEAYGFKGYFLLDFPAAGLDTVPRKTIIDALFSIFHKVKPDTVYCVGNGDVNTDHDVIYEALMAAAKPAYVPFLKEILLYEVISSTNWAFPVKSALFLPNVFVDISGFIMRKLEIIALYGEEIKGPPHPRSIEILKSWGKVRGSAMNVEYAEVFHLARKII